MIAHLHTDCVIHIFCYLVLGCLHGWLCVFCTLVFSFCWFRLETTFSSAWLYQQSSWNRNLSIVRPSSVRVAFISEPIKQIPFKFQLWLPLRLNQGGNGHFWKKKSHFLIFGDFFNFSLTLDPIGDKNSKRYSSIKSLWICSNFFSEFSSHWCSQHTVLDFWNFEFLIFQDFLALTWNLMGAKNSKSYSSLKSLFDFFQSFSRIFFLVVLTEVMFWIFEILSFWFFFANLKFTIVPYG